MRWTSRQIELFNPFLKTQLASKHQTTAEWYHPRYVDMYAGRTLWERPIGTRVAGLRHYTQGTFVLNNVERSEQAPALDGSQLPAVKKIMCQVCIDGHTSPEHLGSDVPWKRKTPFWTSETLAKLYMAYLSDRDTPNRPANYTLGLVGRQVSSRWPSGLPTDWIHDGHQTTRLESLGLCQSAGRRPTAERDRTSNHRCRLETSIGRHLHCLTSPSTRLHSYWLYVSVRESTEGPPPVFATPSQRAVVIIIIDVAGCCRKNLKTAHYTRFQFVSITTITASLKIYPFE